MKKIILSLLAFTAITVNAQTNVNLKLSHEYNGSPLAYGQYYVDGAGNNVEFVRVQYYMTAIDIIHDGGQHTIAPEANVLASGNISTYQLGSMNVTNIEGIDFELGVDSILNHADPALQTSGSALALQSPSMHWGWSSGYRFLVIEGRVDDNGNGLPNKSFEFHVVGNKYLRDVSVTAAGLANASDIDINLIVNVGDWLKDVDLIAAGFNHGELPLNDTIMDNTNPETVFEPNLTVGITPVENEVNQLMVNYEYSYAPTLFYSIEGAKTSSLVISDLNGRILVNETGLSAEGNYFINKELAKGLYVVKMVGDNNHVETTKMFIK